MEEEQEKQREERGKKRKEGAKTGLNAEESERDIWSTVLTLTLGINHSL